MSYRKTGEKILSTLVKSEKNIQILEKMIYRACEEDNDEEEDKSKEEENSKTYFKIVYDICGWLIKDPGNIKMVGGFIKENRLLWNSKIYDSIQAKIEEHDSYLENPFELAEGIFTCHNCGSNKVFSFSKQVRSADEGTSTFCRCSQCQKSWVHSG